MNLRMCETVLALLAVLGVLIIIFFKNRIHELNLESTLKIISLYIQMPRTMSNNSVRKYHTKKNPATISVQGYVHRQDIVSLFQLCKHIAQLSIPSFVS
jgi:hypothetical protein